MVTENQIINAYIRMNEADNFDDVPDEVIEFLKDAALEKIAPTPASLEDEAARLYPDTGEDGANEYMFSKDEIKDIQRSAHITCAGMYTGEIDRLKALLKFWVAPCECETCTKNWDEYKAKHNL